MHQSSVIHHPLRNLTPEQSLRAKERRERIERIARNAYSPPRPVIAYTPPPPAEPVIENELTAEGITECDEQVVVVSFERAQISCKEIQRLVCNAFKISQTDMISARRTKHLVMPRHIAMYLCKTLTLRSLPEIGRRFGDRDHTTILHAVRKITDAITRDEGLRVLIDELSSILGGKASYYAVD